MRFRAVPRGVPLHRGLLDGVRWIAHSLKGAAQCLAIEVDLSLKGGRLVSVLEHLYATRGLPKTIVLDNSTKSTGRRWIRGNTGAGAALVHSLV